MELRLQNAVLLARVLDDLVLVALEPTDDRRDQRPQRTANLRARLAEYSPASTDAGIVFAS